MAFICGMAFILRLNRTESPYARHAVALPTPVSAELTAHVQRAREAGVGGNRGQGTLNAPDHPQTPLWSRFSLAISTDEHMACDDPSDLRNRKHELDFTRRLRPPPPPMCDL